MMEAYESSDEEGEITPTNLFTIYEKGFYYVLLDEKTVGIVEYERIGQLEGAISAHMREIFKELKRPQRFDGVEFRC